MATRRSKAIRHTQKRARQRFGIETTAEDNAVMVRAIQEHRGLFVAKVSNRVTVFDLDYRGASMRVMYDKVKKVILTVLTKDMQV